MNNFHPAILIVIAISCITSMLFLMDISHELQDIRSITSEIRDAAWCAQFPTDPACIAALEIAHHDKQK